MSIFSQFTDAEKRAWDWIRAFADEDYTATRALREYRQEGGAIRTQDWYRVYNSYTAYEQTWDTLNTFGLNETIPERFWLLAPRSFANTYVAEVELALRNNITGELQRTFRYIESDYRMSQGEINQYLDDLGTDYIEAEQWHTDFIYGYKFYKKGG